MKTFSLLFISILLFFSCKKSEDTKGQANELYFPSTGNAVWETTSPSGLGWNEAALQDLYSFLQQKNTKAFLVLKNGRIASERYFGTFTKDSMWYWASAGKTLTAFLVGIAQQEGKLSINNKTSQYLGTGWTSLSSVKENLITIRHQLTMTTGLDDAVPESDCTQPSCLQFKAEAGTRWSYHNAPYTLLEKVVEAATGTTYNNYFRQVIRDKIGMNGLWVKVDYNNVYYSNARSMARFGLLMLNKGTWDKTAILNDASYFDSQISTAQNFNFSYGYLTWLNGKSNHMLPQTQVTFNGMLIPNAPLDTYAALGKNDQKIYVVPSQNLVVIRMGDSAGSTHLAASSFDNELWGKLRQVLKQ